jgi:rhodanese-related sulfurtransferase
MPTPVSREQVQQLLAEQQAAVADVLPRAGYDWAHLPGAVHLPLKDWDPAAVARQFDLDRPIIVYCHEFT